MVARNPLFHGRWTAKRFQATVINDIWPEVLFFTLIATMVTLVSEKTSHQLVIPTQLLTVLGTVLGLVISFRTSSAYERYQDGRKMWTNIAVASRNLAQMIWIHVPSQRMTDDDTAATAEGEAKPKVEKEPLLRTVIEKKSMVNLVQAFSVAVKHFLRGEPGVYYQDLYPLVCFLPRFANMSPEEADMLPLWRAYESDDHHFDAQEHNPRSAADSIHATQRTVSLPEHTRDKTIVEDTRSEVSWYRSLTKSRGSRPRRDTFDPEKALPEVYSSRPLKPARNPPVASLYDYFPLFRFFRWVLRVVTRRAQSPQDIRRKKAKINGDIVESNVPLEICLFLSSYTAYLMRNSYCQPAIATGVTNNITALQDTVSNLERIRNTPLPFAYQAHLRMSLWLYLFFLPFQIYETFGYLTIPGTAFAAFLLTGFLEIGQEIENPFNYDLNDLDLDHFCLSIQRELHEITAHTAPEPKDYIFSAWNMPFAPSDRRTAVDLVKGNAEYHQHGLQPGMESIRRTLVQSWRDVDKITREA